ncbi:chlorophyll a/b-binding protein [Leptolyngbya sp. FACHB-261]|uniref:chlorophyll a/b-binding protein n=1 Tax=Leptolyngbya sp. FACHB-261 TaxID=2692806 RepID=UPI001684F930|nr:chlorophyll a/b-binding protein [Leptolyngbya sp. FACHB-261]MBD2103152.1 hypothetical protein [Leptolyngbya sp. FACHB-261]
MATESPIKSATPTTDAANIVSYDRNAFLFGWTPQAEIWNGRFAMIGFVAYLLWDIAGYSVVQDVLNVADQPIAIPPALIIGIVGLLAGIGVAIRLKFAAENA